MGVWFFLVPFIHERLMSLNELMLCAKPTIVLDDQGHEWTRFQSVHKQYCQISMMPLPLINAFLATEDHEFFSHAGVSVRAIMRALLMNLVKGERVQGASTITQQLVKLVYFDASKLFSRKIKEQIFAILVERLYAKEFILEAYLNTIYCGCGIYGVQAAAEVFWQKPLSELTLAEVATIAGIVRNPRNYCPLLNPTAAQKRRNVVLQRMLACNFITTDEYNQAREEPLNLTIKQPTFAHHLREMIRSMLENIVGHEKLYNHGYVVQTTLNRASQLNAEFFCKKHIAGLRTKTRLPLDGGLLCIEVQSGAIKALVGGYDYVSSQYNRVKAHRQLGSIIKPFLYGVALEQGADLRDVEIDEPLTMQFGNQTWSPRNFNRIFDGTMTLAKALMTSNNIIAIKTLLRIGYQPLITLLKELHITQDIQPYPSLALGCIDVTLWQATAMMNIFAHRGKYEEPYYIEWIKDQDGKKIWRHQRMSQSVIPWRTANCIAKILEQIIVRLEKRFGAQLPCAAFGKTGTTNDARSLWFVASTPTYTTGVYLGCDDNRAIGDTYASLTAFPLWLDFTMLLPAPQKEFVYEPSLREIIVDRDNGHPPMTKDAKIIKLLI